MNKTDLRKSILQKRRTLSVETVTAHSQKVTQQIIQLIEEASVKVLHTYLPIQNEVDTMEIVKYALNQNIKVVVPRTLADRKLRHLVLDSLGDLVEGKFKTLYPKSEQVYNGRYDLILIPAVAFDKENNRLGYGAGYYDTFLENHQEALKVGLAYDFQVVGEIQVEEHDIPMDRVIY